MCSRVLIVRPICVLSSTVVSFSSARAWITLFRLRASVMLAGVHLLLPGSCLLGLRRYSILSGHKSPHLLLPSTHSSAITQRIHLLTRASKLKWSLRPRYPWTPQPAVPTAPRPNLHAVPPAGQFDPQSGSREGRCPPCEDPESAGA